MIKKEYIQPEIKGIRLQHTVLSTISGPEPQGEAPGTVTPNSIKVDFADDYGVDFEDEYYE